MSHTDPVISFQIREGAVCHQIDTYPHAYRNLMLLIIDHIYLDEFGACKGMGRCGTCLVEIITQPATPTLLARNENATLSKLGIAGKNIRLACQILIDEQLNGCVFRIPD